MAHTNWEADKMLDVYIHDYLLKKNLHNSAKTFMTEGNVSTDPIAIDAPGGFLFEWWSVFWDIFISRSNLKHSEPAAAYIESQKMKMREQQQQQHQLQIHHVHLMQQRNAQLQGRDPNHPPFVGTMNTMSPEGVMGQPSANVLAMKLHEDRMKHPPLMDSDPSSSLLDVNRLALLKSPINRQGQLVQNNPIGMSPVLQQIQGRPQMAIDIKVEGNLVSNQKSLPVDPSSHYGQSALQSKSGPGGTVMNQGASGLPLKGWPLTGIDQLRPNMGLQVQRPNLQSQNQFVLSSQQQQTLPQAQAQGNLSSPPNYGFGGMARANFNTKEAQHPRNDGPVCSPGQSNSSQIKMTQMQLSSSQQQDQLQHQQRQLEQNNRKRKPHSSSGAANSTGTGNTGGPLPTSPPSTHTPGDGIDTSSSLQRINSVSKPFMYGSDGVRGIHPSASANHLDDLENYGDVGPLEDNVESFLLHDEGDENIYGAPKQTPSDLKMETGKGFFTEAGFIRTRNKVLCCNFSSDGKLVASGGHDKRAVVWNMDTLQIQSTPQEHDQLVSDICFQPNGTQLVTVSHDKSLRLWDAANPSYCLQAYTGHTSHIQSLDFYPKKNDLLCFCDSNNEIRYWNTNTNTFTCCRVSKQGGKAKVRFQPMIGNMIAAASDNIVTVYDVENDRQIYSFQGHTDVVNLSWHLNGDFLASVNTDAVKVWSTVSGELVHELIADKNEFHSCVFHPKYPALLVIGGSRNMELWNMAENKRMTSEAHESTISALAYSSVTGLVASASHDSSVKLWK